ncbi:O-antigen ligase family protein [Crassaminicella thermophila]|uniref:O-antigen ligase family protein n=1 Tax=Crassaminicella thermophila TaxID=2599308 RepID=A0A5C0SEY1_CRATE|nr:O-antigen ligase family protein [Crassaminicella thermophila]QEK13195.1 O-antigen ligase family protein [Crassaminicella thermophila]
MSKSSRYSSIFISLVLYISPLLGWTFNKSTNIYVRFALYLLLLGIFAINLLNKNTKYKLNNQILIPFYLYLLWTVLRINRLDVGLEQFVMLVGLFTLIIILGSVKWDKKDIDLIISSGMKILILLVICGFLSGFGLGKPMTGFFLNANLYGGILLSYMFFPIYKFEMEKNNLKKRVYFLLISIAAAAIVLSFSRASWVGLIIGLNIYIYMCFLEKRNKMIKLIIGFMILLILTILLLPYFSYLNNINLQRFSAVYLGKRLETGRIDIWFKLVNSLKENYWFGYGTGVEPSLIDGKGLSAHNLYIQVLFQQGVIGLFLLIFLFFSIIRILFKLRSDKFCKVTFVIFSGLLMRDFFEVSIIQNNIIISVFIWSLIGISNNEHRVNLENKVC